jgi:hypothetical protein
VAKITLLDGKIYECSIPSGDVSGEVSFGKYSIEWGKIRSVSLKGHPKTEPFKPEGVIATVIGLKGEKVEGTKLDRKDYSFDVGDFNFTFSSERVKGIELNQEQRVAKITLLDGKIYECSIPSGDVSGEVSFGKYSIEWGKIRSVSLKGHPVQKTPPAKTVFPIEIISKNGMKIDVIEINKKESKITHWQPMEGFPLLLGSFEHYIDIGKVKKVATEGVNLLITLFNNETLSGKIASLNISGKLRDGDFSIPLTKIEAITFKKPELGEKKSIPSPGRISATIGDADGNQMDVSDIEFYGKSHQCGNCIFCCAGGSFSQKYMPVISSLNKEKVEIQFTQIREIYIDIDKSIKFTSKKGTSLSATIDDFLLNGYCECRDGFGFIGTTNLGSLFIPFEKVKSVTFR